MKYDEGTTDEEMWDGDFGMRSWNDLPTFDEYELSYHPDGVWTVTFTEDIPYEGGQVDGRTCRKVGPYCPNAFQIRVRRSLPEPRKASALSHEFGHALGLSHVSDPSALMHPVIIGHATIVEDSDGKESCPEALKSIPQRPNESDMTECQSKDVCPMVVVRPAHP